MDSINRVNWPKITGYTGNLKKVERTRKDEKNKEKGHEKEKQERETFMDVFEHTQVEKKE